MDIGYNTMHSNGHEHGNGHEHPHDKAVGPRIEEDAEGTTIDSGSALCRVSAARGGRIERWQWRAVSPVEAAAPGGHAKQHPPLELVDPRHGSLIDHFLPLGSKPTELQEGTHREFGDFVDEPYRSQTVDSGGEIRIGLLRDGAIRAGKRVAEVRMAKSVALRPGSADVAVLYRVINSSIRPLQILFAIEFNLYAPGLAEGQSADAYYLVDGVRPDDGDSLNSEGISPNATHVALVNPGGEMALQLGWDRESDLWRLPPQGGGAGARLFSVWRIMLPPRDNWAMGLWMAPS